MRVLCVKFNASWFRICERPGNSDNLDLRVSPLRLPIAAMFSTPFVLNKKWWAHWDSNPEPKDYAYHFGFRRRYPCVVWTMPSPYRRRLRWVIMASTPYRVFTRAWLGVGSPRGAGRSPNLHLTNDAFPRRRPVKVLCSNR